MHPRHLARALSLLAATLLTGAPPARAAATADSNPTATLGYYRFPSLRAGTIVFTARTERGEALSSAAATIA